MTPYTNKGQRRYSQPTAVVLLAAGLAVLFCAAPAHANNDSIRALIRNAGNADSDQVRLDYLKQLRKQPDLQKPLKDDLEKLINQIERWINEKRLDYFGGQVRREKDFDFKIAENLLCFIAEQSSNSFNVLESDEILGKRVHRYVNVAYYLDLQPRSHSY